MFYVIFFIIFFEITIYLLLDKLISKKRLPQTVVRVICVIWMTLRILCHFLPDSLAVTLETNSLTASDITTKLLIIMRWLNDVSFIVLPICCFYKKKYFAQVATFFSFPIWLISVILFSAYLPTFMSGNGLGKSSISDGTLQIFLSNQTFRTILFGIMFLMQGIILCYIAINSFEQLRFENKKQVLLFIATLLTLVVTVFPIYGFQHLFGYTTYKLKAYSIGHIAWLLEIAIEIIVVTKLYKNKSAEDKHILLLVLTLALIYLYSQMFNIVGSIKAKFFPLQLCNIAGMVFLIALLTKSDKLYHFSVATQVPGALFALLTLNMNNTGIFDPWNIHYIVEHQNVIIVPLLMMTLHVYKPLEKKDVKDAIIGFGIYYIVVLIAGWVLNAQYLKTGNDFYYANYFFMFDRAKAVEFFPAFGWAFDTSIVVTKYWDIKLIQLIVFIAGLGTIAGSFALLRLFDNKLNKSTKTTKLVHTAIVK